MAITIRNLFARLASALDIWRHEPDPVEAAAAEMRDDRNDALAAGLVIAGGLDGFESVYAAQAAIRQAMLDHALQHEYWHNPPVDAKLN